MSDASEAALARLSEEARARHDALRAEVRRIAETLQRTMTEISREVGTPYGTFSQWVNGTYAGRVERIDEQVERWLSSRTCAARKLASLPPGPAFVATPAAQLFMATLEHAQHAPDLGVITGAAGVGKTTAAAAYRAQSSNVWIVTGEPCMTTPRMMLDEIAEQLGVTMFGGSHKVSRAVVARLRGTRGLLIIDEAQHLRTETLDQLRTLHDMAEVGVVFMGNERVASKIEGGSRSPEFAQLFSRIGMRTAKTRPARADVEALLDGWEVAGAAERKVLATIARKPGALRLMVKVLRIARMQATGAGEALSVAAIEMAFQHLAASPLDVAR